MRFSELFEKAANRAEVVCTFLALLELIRLKQLACAQPEPFAEIEISRAVAPVAVAEENATGAECSAAGKPKMQMGDQITKRLPRILGLFALLVSVPLTARADAGTPLMWAGMLHLVFGNAIIGIFEGLILAWLFKLSKKGFAF